MEQYVIIAGGRDFNNYQLLCSTLYSLVESGWLDDNPVIISGLAKGADSLAIDFANQHNLTVISFPAKWKDMSEPCVIKYNNYGPYNALAGHNRNAQMASEACTLIAFWDGKSTGTKNMIDTMTEMGKRVHVVKY